MSIGKRMKSGKLANKGSKKYNLNAPGRMDRERALLEFEAAIAAGPWCSALEKTAKYAAVTQPGAVVYCILLSKAEEMRLEGKDGAQEVFEATARGVAKITPRSNQEGTMALSTGAMVGTAVGVLADSITLGTVTGIGVAVGTVTVLKKLSEDPDYGTELGRKLHPYVQKGKDGFSTAKDWVCGLFTKKAPA